MTREPDPDPTPPKDDPHGLVEEIREEIEQVVEHVPKPVRWTVRKLVLLIGLGIAGLILLSVVSLVLYFANRTELVAQELVLFANGTLAQRTDLALEFADIRGNPFSEVRLIRPRIKFRDEGVPVLLESPEIRLKYSAWAMITGRGRTIEIDLMRPVIRLTRRPDGRLRLPVWKASGKAPRPGRGLEVRLRMHGGTLEAPEPLSNLEGVDLESAITLATGTRVRVPRLSWKRGFYETRDLSLSAELSAGDSVHFAVHRLRTPDLALSAQGAWKKGGTLRVVHADVERLRWKWLALATRNQTFDVPGEGRVTVDAHGDTSWSGRFAADLDWKDVRGRADGGFSWVERRLTLQPLRLDSPAGKLVGDLAWSKQRWEIGGDVTDANPAHWGIIGVTGWPEGNLDGTMRYVVDTRFPRAQVGDLTATVTSSELGGWTADRADVAVHFPVGPDSFTVAMERRGGTMTLRGATTEGGWQGVYAIERLPLEEWPDGRKSGLTGILDRGEGTVNGTDGKLLVTGSLSGSATDWLGARIARWNLPDVRGTLLPKPDLETQAMLENTTFLGIQFDSTAMDLRLLDQSAELRSVEAHASDTVLTMAGRADWNPGGWRMALDRAEARSSRFHWVAEPTVLLAGDAHGVVFDRLKARDGTAGIDIAGRWASPGGNYEWNMNATGVDLSRLGMPEELALVGTVDARLEVRGPSGRPRWSFDGRFSQPGMQQHRADSLVLDLTGGPGTLDVQRATLLLGAGTLEARVIFQDTAQPWPDSLAAPHVQRWLARAAGWRGEVTAERFPLERLERLAPQAKGWVGELSGRVGIAGSPARPELGAEATAKPLAWQGYRVDDAKAVFGYSSERLEVKELLLTRGNLVSRASGSMPLRLAVGENPEVLDAPMSWKVEIPNGDLSVMPLFVPQFGAAAGKFELNARIEGTPRHPDVNGFLRVSEGVLRMAGREETLEQVSAVLRLDETRITLDSLQARQGERGRVTASGAVELAGEGLKSYAFDVRLRDFTAVETGLYAAQFDGDFKVTNGTRVRGQILPHVEGRAEIKSSAILFDFANQSEMQQIAASTAPLFWTYRIQVNAIRNLRWQPPDGEIEFSANLNLEQTPSDLIIYGEMSAIRGYYYFLSNRFNVTRADLTFDNVEGVNPVIDAEATTRIRTRQDAAAGAAASDETHNVTVRITGRANEPAIAFSSDPADWDESQILRELTLLEPLQNRGAGALSDPVDNYVTRAINKTLSAEMSRVFQGYINEWEVERERGGIWGSGDVIIGIGGQVTPQVNWRYRQRVPGLGREVTSGDLSSTDPFEREVEAEYRLNRYFYITSEVIQRRTVGGGTVATPSTPDFNLNLKARWEY